MVNYTENIRRWAADDRRAGVLPDADGIGEVGLGAEDAGRKLAVRFALRVRAGRAETVRYQVFGCGFTIAACAAAAELAEGSPLAEINAITSSAIDAVLAGLPEERGYCAELAAAALQAAAKSVGNSCHPVHTDVHPDSEGNHHPRITTADPLYRLLIDSPAPGDVLPEDRHLFACLLAVVAEEPCDNATALGLNRDELVDLVQRYFPAVCLEHLPKISGVVCPQANPDITDLLLAHLPHDADGWSPTPSLWLARILATRAACPGHLWRAMGLFGRSELTKAIGRHLPALAAANAKGMRWKRFLFKQLCERNGGAMCKTPDCGTCSDYALCFAGE